MILRTTIAAGALSSLLVSCGPTGGDETAGTTPTSPGAGAKTASTSPPAGTSAAPDTRPAAASNGAPTAVPPAPSGDPGTIEEPAPTRPPLMTFELASVGLPDSGMWKCDPAFADVNGDGHLDLAAIPRLGNGPRVWLGDGKGAWTESSKGLKRTRHSCGGGLDFGDLNNDGQLDLAVADHCDGVYVYIGNGRGDWMLSTKSMFPTDIVTKPGKERNFQGAEDLVIGDVDEDGNLDLIVGGSDDGGISLYIGDGTGSNWTRRQCALPTEGWCVRVALEDVNDDDHLDVVAAHSDGPRVWLGDGTGEWQAWSDGMPSPTVTGLFTGIAVGDVDEDGRKDVIVANWVDGPEVYLQQDDGFWFKTPDVFPKMLGGAIGLDVGDLDQDGHLDIAVSGRLDLEGGYVRGVFPMRGNGKGGFEFEQNTGLPSTGLMTTVGVALGDVNGDGVLDVAAASGLIIESRNSAAGPVIPNRLLVWTTRLPGARGASVEAGTAAADR